MKRIFIAISAILIFGCTEKTDEQRVDLSVDFEKYELANGLDVIFHIDRSDPVVAVALTAHVGSAREVPGRTGFAHLFEHLLFLESENLGKGGLDKMSARIGGSGANGSTSRDRTNYFQTVPKDALEKMLWAEADKLGWFINTVTDPVLAKEKQVVKNEKRQGVDNQPYGHTQYVIDKHLYPEDHPYNWQVIGSLEDLQNATLEDVKEFFRRWYVPNNVTLVVSGDFDEEQAKKWISKYFDEIPMGAQIEPLPKRSGVVHETTKLYHEDNFARLPELNICWPAVEFYHPDSYALDILAEYLSEGKSAPLYKAVSEEAKQSSNVSMFNYSTELAGQLYLTVRAFADTDLDSVMITVENALMKFEEEGIPQKDLDRIKAGLEIQFYNRLSSVLGKGFQLAQYNIFAGDPGFISDDIGQTLEVSRDDVMRVYEKYIKGKDFIATSFVPKGQIDLALDGSLKAEVVEEEIILGAEEQFDASIVAEYEKTPSSFDRSIEPEFGESPDISVPEIWEMSQENGLNIYGITNTEVPLVNYNLTIEGGQLLDNLNKVGVANMTAGMMMRGTVNKTAEELEAAIQQLGANINVSASKGNIRISVTTLSRNFSNTIELVEEIITQPRWDEEEFSLLKQSTINRIRQQSASPNAIAQNTYNLLIYGQDNIRGRNILGSEESVNSISLQDLIDYHNSYISPSVTKLHVVGSVEKQEVEKGINILSEKWEVKDVTIPVSIELEVPESSQVYFYNVPGAKQSVLRFGYPALSAKDSDYYSATVMNYILGGGGFASQLTQQLREGKGYTYGVRSSFSGGPTTGPFTISSGVRSNVTLEASQLVKEILENYSDNYSEQDLETSKSFMIKSNARAFETSRAKLNLLENISTLGWDYNYIKDREQMVKSMTVDQIKQLADKYLDPNKMYWLVVGDADTQLDRMKNLGFGEPILINSSIVEEQ